MRRHVCFGVVLSVLTVIFLGMAWQTFTLPGSNAQSTAASPTSELAAVREREVTRIVPLPVEVEVMVIATETLAPWHGTATAESLTPTPLRPPTRTPRPTETPTPPFNGSQHTTHTKDDEG